MDVAGDPRRVRPVRRLGAGRFPARPTQRRPRPGSAGRRRVAQRTTRGRLLAASRRLRPAEPATAAAARHQRADAGRQPGADLGSPGHLSSRHWRQRHNFDVFADCGRLAVPHPPTPVLQAADLVLVVVRPNLPSISATAAAIRSLRHRLGRTRQRVDTLGLAVVGTGHRTPPAEITKQLKTPVVVELPADDRSGTRAHARAAPSGTRGRCYAVRPNPKRELRGLIARRRMPRSLANQEVARGPLSRTRIDEDPPPKTAIRPTISRRPQRAADPYPQRLGRRRDSRHTVAGPPIHDDPETRRRRSPATTTPPAATTERAWDDQRGHDGHDRPPTTVPAWPLTATTTALPTTARTAPGSRPRCRRARPVRTSRARPRT